jgi:hypothetical protein
MVHTIKVALRPAVEQFFGHTARQDPIAALKRYCACSKPFQIIGKESTSRWEESAEDIWGLARFGDISCNQARRSLAQRFQPRFWMNIGPPDESSG